MTIDPKITQQEEEIIPAAEWAVAGVGLALVCACLGFLFYKAYFVEDGSPTIEFRVERILAQDKGVLVLVEATNQGGQSVSNLQIVGRSESESSEVMIDFLPARSSRSFGIFFSNRPTAEGLDLKAVGYQEP